MAMPGQQMPTAEETAKGMKIAEQEMEYRVDLFNRCGLHSSCMADTSSAGADRLVGSRMVAACFDKCMDKRRVQWL